ncbi:DUF397 domain-containing protein [Glycomyces salinus]|uniref:DUF397 domain-containing protein n=1 Tax=Glycomyces salinus TaxID=980294 RepID=UPI0018EDFC4F|nr:DUF397 domain-containing protein [Glycomyces salinus]
MSHGAGASRWPRDLFRKSTRSNGGGSGQCVAVAAQGDEVALGDTKTPVADTYAHIVVSTADFSALIAAVKSGEID